jgi:putative ABC transport system ATP-binding protein
MFGRKRIPANIAHADGMDESNAMNQLSQNGRLPQAGVIPQRQIAPLIEMQGVVKDYPTANGSFRALKGIDLKIYPGEFVAVVGKSGAGKTTLMNMLTGVDHLSEGEVWIDGTPVHALNENQLALWRGKKMGIIYQSFYLMPTLSLLHNVMLPMDFNGLFHPRKSVERGRDLLRQMELAEHAGKLPSAISGGQQQRVAIARALANDPPIIVADEPTGRLDSTTAETIFRVFQALVEQGKTIVMVTHDQGLARRVSRTIYLADGQIAAEPITPVFPPQSERRSTFQRLFNIN